MAKVDAFEECYEPELRLDPKHKKALIKNGWAVYVYHDGKVVGESYGARPEVIKRILGEDIHGYCEEYVYGTTVLPEYQGRGYGKELASLALIATFPRSVCGHATTPAMQRIRKALGAVFPNPPIERYCGTDRIAHYYEHRRGTNAQVKKDSPEIR